MTAPRWFNRCSFCSLPYHQHDDACPWSQVNESTGRAPSPVAAALLAAGSEELQPRQRSKR